MYRAKYIIALLILAMGLVACKKEQPTLQSETFVIKDISEYDPLFYKINYKKFVEGSFYWHRYYTLTDTNDIELHFNMYLNQQNNAYYSTHSLSNNSVDSSLTFITSGVGIDLKQFKKGDIISDTLNWVFRSAYNLNNWPSHDTLNCYIPFRKRIGTNYKYGFLYYYKNTMNITYGPAVIQR